MRVGVALGSNLGERLANLRNARKDIAVLGGVLPPMRSSAVYETDPVGCEKGAAKFLNAVIEFGFSGEPEELLRALATIEKMLGRPGAHPRNVSRLAALCVSSSRSPAPANVTVWSPTTSPPRIE